MNSKRSPISRSAKDPGLKIRLLIIGALVGLFLGLMFAGLYVVGVASSKQMHQAAPTHPFWSGYQETPVPTMDYPQLSRDTVHAIKSDGPLYVAVLAISALVGMLGAAIAVGKKHQAAQKVKRKAGQPGYAARTGKKEQDTATALRGAFAGFGVVVIIAIVIGILITLLAILAMMRGG